MSDPLVQSFELACAPEHAWSVFAERTSLWRVELGEDAVELLLEQVGHTGEGELRLRLTRARAEHHEPIALGRLDPGPPDRRLADAGLALDDERPRQPVAL